MKRIIVLGGFGFFGRAAVERLRADGCTPLISSRRADADVQVDVENSASIRTMLRAGDVAIDCVGPFQDRTTKLVEAAIEMRFDVVDIADSLDYVEKIYALESRIAAAGISVLTACSSISTVSTMMVQLSGIAEPIRVTGFLGPASRFTAVPATAKSLLRSVGRPIRVLREGRLEMRIGWKDRCDFATPTRKISGHSFESADVFTLPKIWPSLRDVDFYVDTNVPGLNAVLPLVAMVARWRPLLHFGLAFARLFGSTSGCLAYEIEGANGESARMALIAKEHGYFTPIIPAVMAACAIAGGRFPHQGLVPPDRHVDPNELISYLKSIGVELLRL